MSRNESSRHEQHLELETAYRPATKSDQQQSITQFVHTNHRSIVPPSTPPPPPPPKQPITQQRTVETIEETLIITQNKESVRKDARKDVNRIQKRIDDGEETKKSAAISQPDAATIEHIDKLSVVNRTLTDQLQSVRNQLSDNLARVRDFEDRVRMIPKLQLELSVEKAENRDLHLKLKALENIIEMKKSKIDALETAAATAAASQPASSKPFSAQRVCAMSLESLNVRFPNSSSPTDSVQSYASAPSANQSKPTPSVLQQSVGCMTTKSITRDVGVVTIPAQAVTRSIATNTDAIEQPAPPPPPPVPIAIEKKPLLKSVGTQSEAEVKTRSRAIGTNTDREPSPTPVPKPTTFSVGIMATPNVRSSQCMARPETRSIALDNIYQKVRVRSFGTDPIKHLAEPQQPAKPTDSTISLLKLLDTPSQAAPTEPIEPPEKPKELKSIGVQHSPNVLCKFSQCDEQVIEPPPKIKMHTEYTDTSDLILHIHRGVNTEKALETKNRLTNTERIATIDESTNTMAKPTKTNDTGTNPDLSISSKYEEKAKNEEINVSEQDKCHNCLAKIEIKQRTIIKNLNKPAPSATVKRIATTNTTTLTTNTSENVEEKTVNTLLQSQQTETESRIPRPTALISPRPDRKFVRQNTYTIPESPTSDSAMTMSTATATTHSSHTECPAEAYFT